MLLMVIIFNHSLNKTRLNAFYYSLVNEKKLFATQYPNKVIKTASQILNQLNCFWTHKMSIQGIIHKGLNNVWWKNALMAKLQVPKYLVETSTGIFNLKLLQRAFYISKLAFDILVSWCTLRCKYSGILLIYEIRIKIL